MKVASSNVSTVVSLQMFVLRGCSLASSSLRVSNFKVSFVSPGAFNLYYGVGLSFELFYYSVCFLSIRLISVGL